jgi:cell division transport system permease protein
MSKKMINRFLAYVLNITQKKMAYSILIARNTIAGRSLIAVISIMSFLASLSLGFVFLMNQASYQWTQSISRSVTIQVRPMSGRNLSDDVSKLVNKLSLMPGLSHVKELTQKESEQMLEPWLGSGLNLSELPIPRLIIADIDQVKDANYTAIQESINNIIPNASLDDHEHWNNRLKLMSGFMVLGALVIFILVMIAMVLVVSFVTQGTMAENSEVINVLHYVGAENIYIAKEFQVHFLMLGLRGGALGGFATMMLFFTIDKSFEFWAHGPEGEQLVAFLGQPSLTFLGYVSIACVAALAGFLTAFVCRVIVIRHLNKIW